MKGSAILKGFLIVLAAVFIIHQIISSVYNPVETESAVYYSSTDGFDITGIIIRNEKLVNHSGSGVKHFIISDGNRVAKDGVIANVYDNSDASIKVSELEALNKKIKDIEDILRDIQ